MQKPSLNCTVFNQKLCFSPQLLLANKAQIHFLSIIISQANCKIATEKWVELKEPFILKAGVKRNSAYSIAVYLAQTFSYDKVSHSAARTSTSGCRALGVYTTHQLTAKAKLLEQNGSAFVPWTPPNLLLKTPHTWHRAQKNLLVMAWKLCPYLQPQPVSRVSEGFMCARGGQRPHQSCPVGLMKDPQLPWRTRHRYEGGMNIMGVVNQFLIAYKACSTIWTLYLILIIGTKHVASG